ncbi:transcription termination/antitermination NusG family protein [Salipiger abyssi]|uniref:transcription termination/antitermination NusG family protein n=1 Tax=Salipiger abyssi TaxID=1250539 RepID=UPI0040587C72
MSAGVVWFGEPDYRELEVDDVVLRDKAVAPICKPGPAGWYALLCAPQRERQAEAWLAARGVYAFHPVTVRRSRQRGRVREYHRRYLPGYVFARFAGVPVAHRVLASPFLFGALCRRDGEWGVLGPKRLAALHEMRIRDERQEQDRRARKKAAAAARRVRAGDTALFRAGPFAGLQCEVVELLADGGARVQLELFGRPTPATASPDDLVAPSSGAA